MHDVGLILAYHCDQYGKLSCFVYPKSISTLNLSMNVQFLKNGTVMHLSFSSKKILLAFSSWLLLVTYDHDFFLYALDQFWKRWKWARMKALKRYFSAPGVIKDVCCIIFRPKRRETMSIILIKEIIINRVSHSINETAWRAWFFWKKKNWV